MNLSVAANFLGMRTENMNGISGTLNEVSRWAATGVVSTTFICLSAKGAYDISYELNGSLYKVAITLGNSFVNLIPKVKRDWIANGGEQAAVLIQRSWKAWRPSAHVGRLPLPLQGVSRKISRIGDGLVLVTVGTVGLCLMHKYIRKTPDVIDYLVRTLLPVVSKGDLQGLRAAAEEEQARISART